MTETELKEKVYEVVIELAVSLTRQGKTMTSEELTAWINQHYSGFQPPYGNSRGVPKPPSFVPRLLAIRKAWTPLSKPSPTVTVHPSGRNN